MRPMGIATPAVAHSDGGMGGGSRVRLLPAVKWAPLVSNGFAAAGMDPAAGVLAGRFLQSAGVLFAVAVLRALWAAGVLAVAMQQAVDGIAETTDSSSENSQEESESGESAKNGSASSAAAATAMTTGSERVRWLQAETADGEGADATAAPTEAGNAEDGGASEDPLAPSTQDGEGVSTGTFVAMAVLTFLGLSLAYEVARLMVAVWTVRSANAKCLCDRLRGLNVYGVWIILSVLASTVHALYWFGDGATVANVFNMLHIAATVVTAFFTFQLYQKVNESTHMMLPQTSPAVAFN